ncbi:Transposon Tf2-9 polyprotein [Eumeta japonica]|uniref:RNA-directed DNA polymerase n=1 Tax=Eumeta variegata TaxID=151549 RepID=A0A4C1X8X7_EUMVA|nr:Transposon Tf2-9 polyprotein [Eumeta japonica]
MQPISDSHARKAIEGYKVSEEEVKPFRNKLDAVLELERPTTAKNLKSFLVFISYYRKFMENYTQITLPLTKLLKKSNKCYWAEECQTVFEILKKFLCNSPILKHFENNDDRVVTRLFVDASGEALDASLMQEEKELREMHPVAYA